jgi:UDP-N-acetylmuramyl pentapeptide phosphotransferase/UDP-N-acetylglucosamine-1-phosphate transferase
MPYARRAAASAATAVIAAAAARTAYTSLTRNPPGGATQWSRTNHRGEPVTLLEGPAAAMAGAAAALAAPGLPARTRAALVAAAAGAGAFGGYDDIAGSGAKRGFRGHLGALAHGEVTTGAVKLGGIGATGAAAAVLTGGPAIDVAVNAALVAGSANLLNLFDLRPGRAIKVALAAGLPLGITQLTRPGRGAGNARRRRAAGPIAATVAVPLGAAAALLPEDLGERAMLGDAGANALGAMLGTAAAGSLSRRSRIALLAGVTALTAASEVVSFTKVIQRTPPLHWLDMLGRRPAHAASPASGLVRKNTAPDGRQAVPPQAVPAQAGPAQAGVPELNGHGDLDHSGLAAPPSR